MSESIEYNEQKRSVLTFNISCKDKKFISNLEEPVQIMPMSRGYIKDSILKLYNKYSEKENSNYDKKLDKKLLVHAAYPILIFNSRCFETENKIVDSLKTYFKLCDKIGASHFLVHGPKSTSEYANFELGLKLLKDLQIESKTNVKICIEMPSFTKEFLNSDIDFDFKFFEEYFNLIISFGFEIVLDTAHLWNNGLDTIHMIRLLKNYENDYTWIHFNGNSKEQFTSDKHVPMFSQDNKIQDCEKLIKVCSELGKICVCEIVYKNLSEWKNFAQKYDFNLISETVFEHI